MPTPDPILAACREAIGPTPRKRRRLPGDIRVRMNLEMWKQHRKDPLFRVHKVRKALFERGEVVWGAIVGANPSLYLSGYPMNCPAMVAFCPDPRRQPSPEAMGEAGARIASLRSRRRERYDDPAVQTLADCLHDGLMRPFGLPTPFKADGLGVVLSATMITRVHLPQHRLSRRLLPLLALSVEAGARRAEAGGIAHYAVPLPHQFWPAELLEHWDLPEPGEFLDDEGFRRWHWFRPALDPLRHGAIMAYADEQDRIERGGDAAHADPEAHAGDAYDLD